MPQQLKRYPVKTDEINALFDRVGLKKYYVAREKVGIAYNRFSEMINGTRAFPADKVAVVAEALGVSCDVIGDLFAVDGFKFGDNDGDSHG